MQAEVKIEIKYCERCGGLFYRRADQPYVYCVHCEPEMRQVAMPKKRARREGPNHAAHTVRGAACA